MDLTNDVINIQIHFEFSNLLADPPAADFQSVVSRVQPVEFMCCCQDSLKKCFHHPHLY